MRILAVAATVTALAMPAFAQTATTEEAATDDMGQMTMLRERLVTVLNECNQISEDEALDQLTLAQISGIVLTASSSDASQQCQEIEAILND